MWRLLVLAAAVLAMAADAPKDDANKKDLERLQGTWQLAVVKDDGKEASEEAVGGPLRCRVAFSGKKMFYAIPPGVAEGTFQIDNKQEPATLDVRFEDGVGLCGIYEVKRDTLRICFTDKKGKERPREFDAKKGSPYTLWVLKRVKE
jgi:uncharacterized protein (TIGR03067 family)